MGEKAKITRADLPRNIAESNVEIEEWKAGVAARARLIEELRARPEPELQAYRVVLEDVQREVTGCIRGQAASNALFSLLVVYPEAANLREALDLAGWAPIFDLDMDLREALEQVTDAQLAEMQARVQTLQLERVYGSALDDR